MGRCWVRGASGPGLYGRELDASQPDAGRNVCACAVCKAFGAPQNDAGQSPAPQPRRAWGNRTLPVPTGTHTHGKQMEGTLAARCPQLSGVTVWQSFPDMLGSAPGFHDLAFLKEERGGSSCPLGSQVTRCPRLPRVGFRASEVPSGKCSPGLLTGETRCSWSLGPGQGPPPESERQASSSP